MLILEPANAWFLQMTPCVLTRSRASLQDFGSLIHCFSVSLSSMSYFLFKSEPDVYSYDDLVRDNETVWDGVSNPTAVKHLREMKPGTHWIFYHTGDERTAVGTGTVVSVDAVQSQGPHRSRQGRQAPQDTQDPHRHQGREALRELSIGPDRPALGGPSDQRTVGLVPGLAPLRTHVPNWRRW